MAIGGGAKSDLLCQILADASGRAVKRLATVEASSLGAAIAAAKGAGWFKSIPQAAAAMAGKPVEDLPSTAQGTAPLPGASRDLHRSLSRHSSDWNARLDAFTASDRA